MTVSPTAERVTESFIDGEPVRSAATYPNIDPSTGATLGDVARAGDKEIDRAVAAAVDRDRQGAGRQAHAKAFEICSGVTGSVRKRWPIA